MSTTQETSVTSSQDSAPAVEVGKKFTKINGDTKTEAENEGLKLTVEELFPWTTEFKKKCRCSLAQPNIVALIRLMKFYARNVSINVTECYTKPYRAAKLKDSISESLLFFLFYFRELVEVCDKNSYLDKMSDLLAMYMDMELKASRRGKEHHSKIAARLTSCLYVYLENSSEHILDTFIKAKFVNRNYHVIIDPVLTKISKSMPESPNCDTMYVRYLLIYRIWKKVNNDAAVKNQINATAIAHLGPPPTSLTPFLAKYVLPKVPKSQANSTKFLLLHKFDIEKSCRLFIQYCKENREDEDLANFDKPNFIANATNADSLEPLGGSGMWRGTTNVDNLMNNVNIPPEGEKRQGTAVKTKCSSSSSDSFQGKCIIGDKTTGKNESGDKISPLKQLKPAKAPLRQKTKKNGDILFIDLTADVITEKVIKKKKQLKLHWLTEVKKKLNSKTIKAAVKKKKAQILATNLSDDSMLSGLVDSTSAGSLSTATTPEPLTCLTNDPMTLKSLSTATTPEPENCVTSNFVENKEISEFCETQPICDVTTTVTESIPVAVSDKLDRTELEPSDHVPSSEETVSQTPTNHTINKILLKSCHTTSEQDKSESWTENELSTALSHICESYNSDNSPENVESKQDEEPVAKIDTITSTVLQSTEVVQGLDYFQRSTSESSEVAVIFTRRGSDVEIVDLDEYTEEVGDAESSELLDEICTLENTEGEANFLQNSESLDNNDSERRIINNKVNDLTLQTDRLELTNCSDAFRDKETRKVAERRKVEFNLERNESNSCVESYREDSQIEQNVLESERSELIGYDIKRHCDYESSKVERLGNARLTPSSASDFGERKQAVFEDKKAAMIQNKYVDKPQLIPKINEISISTNNVENNVCNISSELLTNQEPQFNDNIDGLSLLASVSQHVSHLEEYSDKSLSKPKLINGEVPGSDSGQKNPSEMNRRVEGVDQLLLDLNANSRSETKNEKDVVPLILEAMVDLNSSKLHNSLIPVENVTQMIKESTNMIVNGETVVLFQKSPNSNLYIINKAIDNSTMGCLIEEKKIAAKSVERNSTTMRDIINHIPINVFETHEAEKTLQKTSGVKKNRSDPRNQILSMQLKPIHGNFEDKYIKKEFINGDYYEDTIRQRCTDTPGSVIELEPVKKTPPPIIRLTDTPVDVQMLKNQDFISEESTAINMATTGRSNRNIDNKSCERREGTSNENLITYKKSIKQEFGSFGDGRNHVTGDFQQVARVGNHRNGNPDNFHPLELISSPKIPHVYSTVTKATNFYEHCSFPSCSLKVSSSQPYQQTRTSDIHCREYVQRPAPSIAHSPYLQANSYFLSTDSSGKPDKGDLKLNDATLAKLKDDQLLHNIEQSIIEDKKLKEKSEPAKTVPEMKYKREFENKLPLKKRLKAHAMLSMSFNDDDQAKIERVENYPGTPMMSIAALEPRNVQSATSPSFAEKPLPSVALELSPRAKNDSSHHTTEMIRRDYLKDTFLTSIGNCTNVNIMASGNQRSFKTSAQRKDAGVSQSPLKRVATSAANHPKSPKKEKKSKTVSNGRQTRSSKRNIPKVNYSYDEIIDIELKFNSPSELKRKRKRTSR